MRALNAPADPSLVAGDVDRVLRATDGRPFFLTVFFSATRPPYAIPAPHYAKYTDLAYRGRFKYDAAGVGAEAPPDVADVKQIRGLYDGAVSAVDAAIGQVLRSLEDEGRAGNTIVVLISDQGEGLFENGHGQGHGDHLFGDEGTHVPLVIWDPRRNRPGRRVSGVVRDVDVAPTLYELAGVAPEEAMDGRSLVPALEGEASLARLAYAETDVGSAEEILGLPRELRMPQRADLPAPATLRVSLVARQRMVREERFKLVYIPTRKGAHYSLFDTLTDPGETSDVAAAQPEVLARLRSELWAWMLRDVGMEQSGSLLVPRDVLPARASAAP